MNEHIVIDLIALGDAVYKICNALVTITDFECCMYGFDDVVKMAHKYVDDYEADNKNNT